MSYVDNSDLAAAQFFGSYIEYSNCYTNGRIRGGSAKGIVMIAGVGNDNSALNLGAPAILTEVLGVGATNPKDKRHTSGDGFDAPSSWSSNTPYHMDVCAPGACIPLVDFSGTAGWNATDYSTRGGTSYATPLVSGIALMLLEKDNTLTVGQVYNAIRYGAEKVGGYDYNYSSADPGKSSELGYGRVNAYKTIFEVPNAIKSISNNAFSFTIINPISDDIYGYLPDNKEYNISVYETTGKEIISFKSINTNVIEIPFNNNASGIYIIKVTDRSTGLSSMAKIVKN